MIELDSDNFIEEVYTCKKPVLIEFFAPWCEHCKEFEKKLSFLAEQYNNKIKFVKVNIENNQELSDRFQITKLPTCLIFNGYEITDFIIGTVTIDVFKQVLNEALEKKSTSTR